MNLLLSSIINETKRNEGYKVRLFLGGERMNEWDMADFKKKRNCR